MEKEICLRSLPSEEQQQQQTLTMAQCSDCHQSLATSSGFKAHLLPCLHLLCQRCLSDQSGYPYLHCPVCKKLWDPSDASNYELGDASMRCQMIGCPEKAMAVIMCEECQEALCTGCSAAHRRVTATRGHELNQIPSARSLLCKIHPDKLVQSLCHCRDFVCDQCTQNEHADHQKHVTLEALADRCQGELRVIDENAKKKLIELNETEEQIRKGIDDCGDLAKKQVANAVDRLKDILSKRADAVCDSINGAIWEKQRDEPILVKLQQQCGVWQRAQSFAQEILQCGNPVAAYRSKNQLAECLNRVDQSVSKTAIDHRWQIPIDTSSVHLEDSIRSWAHLSPTDGTTKKKKNTSQTELEHPVNGPNVAAANGGESIVSVSVAEFHQMKEAALANERELSLSLAEIDRLKRKLKEKESQEDSGVQTDSVEVPGVPTEEQLSRAANRKMQEELRQKDTKYKRYKQRYLAERKVTSELRKKLAKKNVVTSAEEVVPDQFSGAHHQLKDTDGIATSPLDRAQIEGQKRRRLIMDQQQMVAISGQQMETIGDNSAVEEGEDGTMAEEAPPATPTAVPATAGSRPFASRKRRSQLLLPPSSTIEANADTEQNENNSVAATGVFKCAQCPLLMPFCSAQRLAEHTRRYHSARHQRFPCPDCGRQFSEQKSLASHQRLSHTPSGDERPFPCDECDRRFKTEGNLKVHKRVHSDERPFVCAVCQAAFKYNSALQSHRRRHAGEMSFACQICAKKFVTSSDCRKHQKHCTDRAAADE